MVTVSKNLVGNYGPGVVGKGSLKYLMLTGWPLISKTSSRMVCPTSMYTTGAASYSVELRLENDKTFSRKFTAFDTNYKISQLEPGTMYKIRAASVGTSFIESDFSDWIVVTTVPETPGIPKIDFVTNSSIELSWAPVKGNALPVNNWKSEILLHHLIIIGISLKKSISFDLYSMSLGLIEGFQVSTHAWQLSRSHPSTIEGVLKTWIICLGAVLYTAVLRKNSSEEMIEENSTSPRVFFSNLEAGMLFKCFLFSVGKNNRKNEVGGPSLLVQTIPETPDNFLAANCTMTSVSLEWDEVAGCLSYFKLVFGWRLWPFNIFSLSGARLYNVYVTHNGGNITSQTTGVTSMIVRDLKPGTTYQFMVEAEGSEGGISEKSPPVSKSTSKSDNAERVCVVS